MGNHPSSAARKPVAGEPAGHSRTAAEQSDSAACVVAAEVLSEVSSEASDVAEVEVGALAERVLEAEVQAEQQGQLQPNRRSSSPRRSRSGSWGTPLRSDRSS